MKQRTKFVSLLLASALLLTLIVGGVAAQGNPRVLTIAQATEADNLNPWLTGLGPSHELIYLINRGPWAFNPEGDLVPVLVENLPSDVEGGITINDEDKTVVRYTLADWAIWSDGTPMSADDFILPFEVSQDGLTAFVQDIFTDNIESVTAGDSPQEVVITYTGVRPDWWFAGFWPLPNHVVRPLWEDAVANGLGMDSLDWNRAPTVSNGPFLFDEWLSGSFMRFTRNDNWFQPAWFEEIVVNFYPDPTVVKTILQNGEADLTGFGQPADAADFKDDDNFVISTIPAGVIEGWYLNLGPKGNPALKDLRVRQAIVMGLNRQEIVDELQFGLTTVPISIYDGNGWEDPSVAPLWPEYDPEGAVALLGEAGWSDDDGDGICEAHGVEGVEDGTPLQLVHTTTSVTLRMDAQVLAQDYLKDICIDLSVNTVEPTLILATLDRGGAQRSGDSDIYHFAVLLSRTSIVAPNYWGCDGITTEDNPAGLNLAHACWPEMDDLWNIMAENPDQAVRQDAANQIQKFMAENVYWIPMWDRPSLVIYGSDLQGVNLVAGDIGAVRGQYWQIHEWSRAE